MTNFEHYIFIIYSLSSTTLLHNDRIKLWSDSGITNGQLCSQNEEVDFTDK